MTLVRLRWLSVILVLGHVRGIQYDVCNDIPTSFSPMCDLGKSYTLDDYQGKVYNRCTIKKCSTATMQQYDVNLGTIEPYPEVTVNHIANFTCSIGYRMARDWFTFEEHISHERPRSSLKNCTSAEKCMLERPPKCLPVRCDTAQYDVARESCPNCNQVSGTVPVDPAGGKAYFVYGVHTLTVQCPAGQSVQGQCDTRQFTVSCQDSGRISWSTCVSDSSCSRRKGSRTRHFVIDDALTRQQPTVDMPQATRKLMSTAWTAASGCTYALPRLTRVLSVGWYPQRTYESGSVLEVACTSGNAFFNSSAFSLTKRLECISNGTHTTWRAMNLAGADCVPTCPVPYSDHDPDYPITVGVAVRATCKTGYRAQHTGTSQDHATCSDSQDLMATCRQDAPGRAARLDKECMKVTCGNLKAYPKDATTVCNKRESSQEDYCAPVSRFSDYDDENGLAPERTRIDCGACFRANDETDKGYRWYYRECLPDCQFDKPAWNCTRLRCGTYQAPANARIISPSNWQSTDRLYCGTTELTVACDEGFVRKGSPPGTCETSFKVKCDNDRQIVNGDETCVPPFCAPMAHPFWVEQGVTANAASFSPAGGSQRVAIGTRLTVTCNEGHRGVIVEEATCADSPSFEALCTPDCVYESADRCQKVVCSLNNVPNIVYDSSSLSPFLPFQSSFQATCQEGFRPGSNDPDLSKDGSLFCGSDCDFTPGCLPVSCGMFLPPSFSKLHRNGEVGTKDESEVFFDDTLTVICDDGYIVEGTEAPECSDRFTVTCGDDGSLSWDGTGRCMPRICDCPGAGECVTTRISCGRYTAPLHSSIQEGGEWTATREYAFGDTVQLSCNEGYVVAAKFPGKPEGSGACTKVFEDDCLPVGMFRSDFEEPCERIKCPTPGQAGLVRVPADEFVDFGVMVSQTCEVGYEPIDKEGEYVMALPLESTCLDTCVMSDPLRCSASQCGVYGAFDYSAGVEKVKSTTVYRGQLDITCKPNYMLDERPWCTTALQTEADGCIPIKGVESALSEAVVLGTTVFAEPENVMFATVYPVTGVYGDVAVRVPPGAWPSTSTAGGLIISAIAVPPQFQPDSNVMTLAGPAISFGPHGIQFLTYVGISLPFDCPGTGSCAAMYAGKTIKPHKLVNRKWVEIPYAAGAGVASGPVVDFERGIVQGQTLSFSTYAALAVINVAAPPPPPPDQSGGPGGGGGGGGQVDVDSVVTSAVSTTAAAVFVLQGTTPPPKIVGKSQCMPCAAKPEFSSWTGISECDFECQIGTQPFNGRCLPCDNVKAANATWVGNLNCEWTCEPGFRVVEGRCLQCALQKPNNSYWIPGTECEWECSGGFLLSQGDCAGCTGGKDFRSHWTEGCNWECDAGYTRNALGCAPCEAKDAQAAWSSDSGCEWTCNPGFANKNGACVKCDVELDGRGQWAPEKYPDEPCTWVCEDGFFLLKKSENRITLPVAIALGAVGGVIFGLLGIRTVLWRRAHTWGRSLAVDEAKAKGDSTHLIPFKEPASGPPAATNERSLVVGDVYANAVPQITNGEKEQPNEAEEQRRQREKEERHLKRARRKVQDMVADVAMLVATKPLASGSASQSTTDEVAVAI